MAALTFRVGAGQDGNFGALAETDQTAATRTDGWTVAKIASAFSAEFDAATKQASGAFTAQATTAKPASFLTGSTANAFKTPNPLTGVFANAAWTLTFAVRASTASAQAGRVRVRVFRSVNASGASATEITGSTQVGTTSAALSTSADVTSVVTWSPGATVTLTNEYLFFVVAWEITTASGSNSGDVLFRTGQSAGGSRFVTPNFVGTYSGASSVALTVARTTNGQLPPKWSKVTGGNNGGADFTTATTVAKTLAGAVAVGDLIVVAISRSATSDDGASDTCADSLGNVYTRRGGGYQSADGGVLSWFTSVATVAGTPTVTVTFPNTQPNRAIAVQVYRSLVAAPSLDVAASLATHSNLAGAGPDNLIVGPVTPTKNGDLIVAGFGQYSNLNTFSAGTGFTEDQDTGVAFISYLALESREMGVAAALSGLGTDSGSAARYLGFVAAFAGVGGATTYTGSATVSLTNARTTAATVSQTPKLATLRDHFTASIDPAVWTAQAVIPTNLFLNGGFESGAASWSAAGSWTLTPVSSPVRAGTGALKSTYTGPGVNGYNALFQSVAIPAAGDYVSKIWVWVPAGFRANVVSWAVSGSSSPGVNADLNIRDRWQLIQQPFHADAAGSLLPFLYVDEASIAAGDYLVFDQAVLGVEVGSPYWDSVGQRVALPVLASSGETAELETAEWKTSGVYDLSNSSYSAKLTPAAAADTEVDLSVVRVGTNGLDQLLMSGIVGDKLYAYHGIGGVYTQVDAGTTTYNPVTHAWMRIREAAGTVYYETSPDGATWNVLASEATPFSVVRVTPHAYTLRYTTAGGTSYVDEVNIPVSVGAAAVNLTDSRTTNATRITRAAATVALTNTRVTAGIKKLLGAATVALTDTRVTNAVRRANAAATVALVNARTTAARLTARVGAAVSLADTVTTAARRVHVGSATVALTDTRVTNGARQTNASATVALTDTRVTNAVRQAVVSATVALTANRTTNATRTARSATTVSLTDTVVTASRVTMRSGATVALTDTRVTNATRIARVSTTVSLTNVRTTAGRLTARAATVTAEVVSVTTAARRVLVGVATVALTNLRTTAARLTARSAVTVSETATITTTATAAGVKLGAATVSLTNTRVTNATRTTFSTTSVPLTDSRLTAARVTMRSGATVPLVVSRVTAATRTVNAAAAVALVDVRLTAARVTFRALAAVALVVGLVTAVTRRTFGLVSRVETVAVTTNATGIGVKLGAASVQLTDARTTNGVRRTFGVVSRVETATVTTAATTSAGATTYFGAATVGLTDVRVTGAVRRTFGAVSRVEAVTVTSGGARLWLGASATTEAVTVTTGASTRLDGTATVRLRALLFTSADSVVPLPPGRIDFGRDGSLGNGGGTGHIDYVNQGGLGRGRGGRIAEVTRG